MTRNEFMAALCTRLAGLPEQDMQKSLAYYNEMIDDCMEDGMNEVEGTLLSVKYFVADAASGDIDIPDSDSHAGTCKVKTGSGDIKIRVLS